MIANKQRGFSSTHIASAISHKIEIHQENATGGTCTRCAGAILTPRKLAKSNVQTNPCDQREPANDSSLYLAVTPSARRPAPTSRRSPPIAPRPCERERSANGAKRSIAAGVWGDGTPPMEGAMAGDGMTVGRCVRIGIGSDRRPMEGAMEAHRGALSMCFRRFDAGPVSTLTILPAVNNRSMAARKASADTPFASGSPANSNGALPRPVLGRTGRP